MRKLTGEAAILAAAIGASAVISTFAAPTPTNLPKGWKVSVSPSGVCRIGKRGFMIFVK